MAAMHRLTAKRLSALPAGPEGADGAAAAAGAEEGAAAGADGAYRISKVRPLAQEGCLTSCAGAVACTVSLDLLRPVNHVLQEQAQLGVLRLEECFPTSQPHVHLPSRVYLR